MSQSADRNLLLGILALQLDFVTRNQLVEGMNMWVLDKTKSLGDIFVSIRAMDEEQRNLLDALVDKHVEKHSGDVQKSIQQLSAIETHANKLLGEINDPDLHATMMHLSGDPFATAAPQEAPKRSSSRFRIIRPHARGGLGEVYLAKDIELSREVALKEIQERYADHSESRARFLREAEVTGRLEHPGIVPVYGLGSYDDGRPFYAMKFVKGHSLQEAIDGFHNDPETKAAKSFMTGNVGIKFRELLGRFIDVCNAVHYAHSRGILHRDLKPGNVMIGEYGETLVVDWGLAKVLKEPMVADSQMSVIETSSESSSAQTIYGSAIGTPGYMSPEQAAGQVDSLGIASDVYSLGVTLYAILTGSAPFNQDFQKKEGVGELLARVKRGQFQNPRELRSGLPKSLTAICLKAMATKAEPRYRSAKSVATEVDPSLADEPVDALPETMVTQASRLARRHRSLLLAVSLSLLAISTISTVAFLVVNEQRKANIKLADTNGRLARDKGELAERNAALFESERQSKNVAQKAATEIGKLASTLSVDKGTDWMISGDLDIAAHWFARACELLPDEQSQRSRLASKNLNVCLDSIHKVERVIFDAEPLLTVVHDTRSDSVITCSLHGKLRQLSLEDGSWTPRCQLGSGELIAAAISPTLKFAATINKKGEFQLWNADTGERLEVAPDDQRQAASALAFSPDGQVLAVAFANGLGLWDCNAQSWQGSLVPTDFGVGSISFDPNHKFMVVGGAKTRVWSLTDQKWLGDLDVGHFCQSLSIDGQGTSILAGRWMEAKLFRWIGNSVQETSIQRHGITFVTSVAFNESSTMLCATGADGLATVWDVETRQRIAQPLRHASQSLQGSLFSKDGRRLITYGGREQGQSELRIWRLSTKQQGELVLRHETGIVSVGYSADGNLITFFDAQSRVFVAERSTGRILTSPLSHASLRYSGAEPCSSLCFTPDNRILCSTSMSGGVCLWDWRRSKLYSQQIDNGQCIDAPNVNSVRDACLSNDGSTLIVAGGSSSLQGYVRAFELTSGRKVNEYLSPGARIHCVTNIPGTDSVLFGGDFRFTKIWPLKSNTSPVDQIEHPGTVYSVAFADGGRTMLAGYYQATAQAWDLEEKLMKGSPLSHDGYVRKLAVSDDRSEFVSSDGRYLRWWDVESQNAIGPPVPIPNYHNGIAFAPDGSEAIVGFPDGALRAFSTQSSRTLRRRDIRNDVVAVTGIHVDDTGAVRPLTASESINNRHDASKIVGSYEASSTAPALTPQGSFQRQVYFGDIDEALATAESWYAGAKEKPQDLYRASSMFAECARLIRNKRQLTLASKLSLVDSVQQRAVEALREAMNAGHPLENATRQSKEFEALRDVSEFQALFLGPVASVRIRALGENAGHLDLAYACADDKVCIANLGTGVGRVWNFESVERKSLDWIIDGQELAVRQGTRIIAFDPLKPKSRRVHVELEASVRQASISPDGSHTVFESTKTYEVPRVILMDNKTRKEIVISQFGYDPCWSRDGKTLALFDVSDTSRSSGVINLVDVEQVRNSANNEESKATAVKPKTTLLFPQHSFGFVYPALSADGSMTAFGMQGEDGTRQIGLATAENGQYRQLTRNGKDNACPAISPDNRYIAYLRNAQAPFELVVWDLEKEEEIVVADEVVFCRPAWRLSATRP